MSQIKIFFASPSDLNDEREIAREVVDRLSRRFSHQCHVEGLFWEAEPLRATHSYQEDIPDPASFDIVVVMLWFRLGSPLAPVAPYLDENGEPLTGTEWEFQQAYRASEQSNGEKPALLVYRKTAPRQVLLEDDALVEEALDQKKKLDQFWTKWFTDGEGNGTTAVHHVSGGAEFESRLEEHLRTLIRTKIKADPNTSEDVTEDLWGIAERGSPYRGLGSFDVSHSAILFGRTKARLELRDLLRDCVERGKPAIMVVGPSGSGKSSVVKAGLLADLKRPDTIGRVVVCRHAIIRPSDADGNLVQALAAGLVHQEALPELLRRGVDKNRVADWIQRDPAKLAEEVVGSLKVALDNVDPVGHAEARLVLVIDQMEELFTSSRTDIKPFVEVLIALAKSKHVWLVATLRGDFFHELDSLPKLKALFKQGLYSLDVPTRDEIAQIIRKPAEVAGLRFEKEPTTGASLAAELESEAFDNPHSLPLLEFALDELFKHRDRANNLTFEHYRHMGGLTGAIARTADNVISNLDEVTRRELLPVLRSLVTVTSPNAEATAVWADRAQLARNPRRNDVIDTLIDARLLVSKGADGKARVRLSHESLIHNWSHLKSIVNNDRKYLILRAELSLLSAKYLKDQDSSFLLWGRRLAEARAVLEERQDDLESPIIKLIEDSIKTNVEREEAERRNALERATTAEALAEQRKKSARTAKQWSFVATLLALSALGAAGYSSTLYYRKASCKHGARGYQYNARGYQYNAGDHQYKIGVDADQGARAGEKSAGTREFLSNPRQGEYADLEKPQTVPKEYCRF